MDEIKKDMKKMCLKIFGKSIETNRFLEFMESYIDIVADKIRGNHAYITNHFLNCEECFKQLGKDRGGFYTEKILKEKIVCEQLRGVRIPRQGLTGKNEEFVRGFNMACKNLDKIIDVYIAKETNARKNRSWIRKLIDRALT